MSITGQHACELFSAAVWLEDGTDLDPREWWESSPTGELDHVWGGVLHAFKVLDGVVDPREFDGVFDPRVLEGISA